MDKRRDVTKKVGRYHAELAAFLFRLVTSKSVDIDGRCRSLKSVVALRQKCTEHASEYVACPGRGKAGVARGVQIYLSVRARYDRVRALQADGRASQFPALSPP